MVWSAVKTANAPEKLSIYVGLNKDDTSKYISDQYIRGDGQRTPLRWRYRDFPPEAKGRVIWNTLAEEALASGASWVWIGSDDIIFETKGWDDELRRNIHPGPHCAWGDDGSCGDRHASHPFLNRQWLLAIGKAMPDCCQQYDGDTFITELAKATGAYTYLPHVSIRHMHHKYGLGVADDTWRNTKPLQKVDYDTYRGPIGRAEFAEALDKLRASIGNSKLLEAT